MINELVPGFRDELVARGGLLHDQHKDVLWYNDGLLLKQAPSDLVGLLASRPLIESVLRKLVSDHPGIAEYRLGLGMSRLRWWWMPPGGATADQPG